MRVRSEKQPVGEEITDEMAKEKCSGAALGTHQYSQIWNFSAGMGADISLFLASADDCCSPNSLSLTVEDGEPMNYGDRNPMILSITFLSSN